MPDMKTITFGARSKARTLHIETDGCIINVRRGLTDTEGRPVTSVSISADKYEGDKWEIADHPGRDTINVRVRKVSK